MERLRNTYDEISKSLKKYYVSAGLVSVLLLGTTSCGKITQNDVNKQIKETECINSQIRSQKKTREEHAKKYNDYLDARKEKEKRNEDLSSIDKVIEYYYKQVKEDREILDDLLKKEVKAENKVRDMKLECIEDNTYYHEGWEYEDLSRYSRIN